MVLFMVCVSSFSEIETSTNVLTPLYPPPLPGGPGNPNFVDRKFCGRLDFAYFLFVFLIVPSVRGNQQTGQVLGQASEGNCHLSGLCLVLHLGSASRGGGCSSEPSVPWSP